MNSGDLLAKFASHFGWSLTAPEVGMFTMENFVFKNSPPTPDERTCYDRLVEKYKDGGGGPFGYAEWQEIIHPLWSEQNGWSRYHHLMDQLCNVFKGHLEALYYKDWFDELDSSPPGDDYDVEAWNKCSDELSKADSLFRSYKKSAGEALDGLLLNAARVSGGDRDELIKSLEEMAEKPIQEKIKSRKGRPNASPIRVNHENDLPNILRYTVDEVEPYWDGVLLWLRQTHSVQNSWKAFGHLVQARHVI